MQTLLAKDIFNNINCINSQEFEYSQNIVLDFQSIDNIDFKSITTLLNIKKVAIINNKSLSLKNVAPNVKKVLDVIGICAESTNPIIRNQ